jgi:Protein of unknown function (DUF4058)
MPVHDWTRVDSGLFHAFHQLWISSLCGALNSGVLPPEYFALPEQYVGGPIPEVLTLKLASQSDESVDGSGGVSVASAPPRVERVFHREAEIYAKKADRIAIRHRHGDVVSVLEIVSPGNKASKAEFRALIDKSTDLIRNGIHLLVVDLFPPGKRDPEGIAKAIWERFSDDDFDHSADKPLTVVSFDAGPEQVVYDESVAVGSPLPDMPLFLRPGIYVPAPLEATYQTTWNVFPDAMKKLLL